MNEDGDAGDGTDDPGTAGTSADEQLSASRGEAADDEEAPVDGSSADGAAADGERSDDGSGTDGERSDDGSGTDGEESDDGAAADADPDPPRKWVEELLAREGTVRDLLSDVERDRMVGDHAAVRSTLRDLADNDEPTFRALAYALEGNDAFFADLREQYDDEEPVERVRDLGERFSDLADEFDRVWGESYRGMKNPDPGIRTRMAYADRHDLPMLRYELHSGDLKLCEAKQPTSQALMVAGMLVDNTADLVETVHDNGDAIDENERRLLALVLDRLVDDVDRLTDEIEGVDDLDLDAEDEDDGYDRNLGFY